MHRRQSRKWQIIGIVTVISLTACSAPSSKPIPVYCHEWRGTDAHAIKEAINGLPDDSALIPVIRDYERLCIALK